MSPLSLIHRAQELSAGPSAASSEPSEGRTGAARELLRLLLGSSHEAASTGSGDVLPLLCDLASAVAELARGARRRAVVRLSGPSPALELGLERAGPHVLVTLFQGGPLPTVLLHERRVAADALASALVSALVRGGAGASEDARLTCAREHLLAALPFPAAPGALETETALVEPTGAVSIVLSAELQLRPGALAQPLAPAVMRADLHALLVRGRLRIGLGDQTRELPDVFVFPVAEQLVALMQEGLEAWTRARPFHRRLSVGGAICGLRLGSDRAASLTLGVARRAHEERAQTWTFPAVEIVALVQGVVAFGRALSRCLVRRERAQASNLRLVSFRASVRELAERLRQATRDDVMINAAPESYRAFVAAQRPASPPEETLGRTRLSFSAKWIAAVPSLDLRATFLCGDGLVVGSARELGYLDRRTGEVRWTRPVPRAATVMTPLGVARLEADGTLTLHDLEAGDPLWSARLAPRTGGPASGVVVTAPGLPRLLVVSEGTRHLAAVDLDSGEVRWRHAARRGGAFRMKRAGKLVIVGCGDASLMALDVLRGEVVWRFCDPLHFATPASLDQDALFAIAGDGALLGRGGVRLHHVDPYSGATRWSRALPAGVSVVGAPLLTPGVVVLATHGQRGTGVVGLDRASGEPLYERAVCAGAASCLAVDDAVVLNSDSGELVAVDATDGAIRYRHVFPGGAEGDRPRRLDPVLRSGALFVPQQEVHVVRPRDGMILGRIDAGIVPDMLRVDERCDVYVAEESGHLAAFSNAPRLTLVHGAR